MHEVQMITMSSLLAGCFLSNKNREISFIEISNILNKFYNELGIDVEETDKDMENLYKIIRFGDASIFLSYEFDDFISIDGRQLLVCEYLYNLTDKYVREYFGIEQKKKIRIRTFNVFDIFNINNKKETRVIV